MDRPRAIDSEGRLLSQCCGATIKGTLGPDCSAFFTCDECGQVYFFSIPSGVHFFQTVDPNDR